MVSHEFLKAPNDLAVLSRDPRLRSVVSGLDGRTAHIVHEPDHLLATIIARRMI